MLLSQQVLSVIVAPNVSQNYQVNLGNKMPIQHRVYRDFKFQWSSWPTEQLS